MTQKEFQNTVLNKLHALESFQSITLEKFNTLAQDIVTLKGDVKSLKTDMKYLDMKMDESLDIAHNNSVYIKQAFIKITEHDIQINHIH